MTRALHARPLLLISLPVALGIAVFGRSGFDVPHVEAHQLAMARIKVKMRRPISPATSGTLHRSV